jgi:hypothetical protein
MYHSVVRVSLALPLQKELRYPLGRRLDISHNRARLDALENIKHLVLLAVRVGLTCNLLYNLYRSTTK